MLLNTQNHTPSKQSINHPHLLLPHTNPATNPDRNKLRLQDQTFSDELLELAYKLLFFFASNFYLHPVLNAFLS